MSTTAWLIVSFLDLPQILSDGRIPAQHDGERIIWTVDDQKTPAGSGFVRFGIPSSDSRLWPHIDGHVSIDDIEPNGLMVEILMDGAWAQASLEEALLISAVQIIEVAKLFEAEQ